MIVDDIEKDHQSQIMRAVDERFEVFRATVGVGGRKWQHPVITPFTVTSPLRDRHQFNRGHAKIRQCFQFGGKGRVRAFRRRSSDVRS